MWHLIIPIPNWTGIVLGFIIGFLVFVAWGMWLNRRANRFGKKLEEALRPKGDKLVGTAPTWADEIDIITAQAALTKRPKTDRKTD